MAHADPAAQNRSRQVRGRRLALASRAKSHVAVRRRFRHRAGLFLPRRRHRSADAHRPRRGARRLQLAGQLLRESVLGLMDLNQSRNEFRNRFRISPPANDGPESPLNFSRGVDEALVRLLTTLSTRAGSVEAIRQNFRELKAQNTASLAATRAAFEEFLGRVDPKELEERFDRATKRGVFGSQSKTKYWELYTEMFAGLGAASGGWISAPVHRDFCQGLRGEIAPPGAAPPRQLRRRSGRRRIAVRRSRQSSAGRFLTRVRRKLAGLPNT